MTYREVAIRAGIDPQQIYNLTRKSNMPRLDKAVAIARTLRIPMEYLSDDAAPIEPVPDGPASLVETGDLCDEVARRFRAEATRLKNLLDQAERMDFKAGLDVLAGRRSLKEASLSKRELEKMKQLAVGIGMQPTRYLAVLSGSESKPSREGRGRRDAPSISKTTLASITKHHTSLCEEMPGFEAFIMRCHLDAQT